MKLKNKLKEKEKLKVTTKYMEVKWNIICHL
jgi:hypothetical protein